MTKEKKVSIILLIFNISNKVETKLILGSFGVRTI